MFRKAYSVDLTLFFVTIGFTWKDGFSIQRLVLWLIYYILGFLLKSSKLEMGNIQREFSN